MPVYTFRLRTRGNTTVSLAELRNDLAAIRRAHKLISEETGLGSVTITEEGRHVVHIVVAATSASVAVAMEAVESAKASISASLSILASTGGAELQGTSPAERPQAKRLRK